MVDQLKQLAERLDRLERDVRGDHGAGSSRATGDLVDRVNVLGARVGKLESAAGMSTPSIPAPAKTPQDEALFQEGHSPSEFHQHEPSRTDVPLNPPLNPPGSFISPTDRPSVKPRK